MTKSFYLTETQIEKIKKRENISQNLKDLIDDENSPIMVLSSPIKNGLNNLLIKGYEDSIDDFKDDITQHSEDEIANKLCKLIAIVKKKEEPFKVQLEGLCEDIISTFSNEDVDIDCKLVTEVPNSKCFHIQAGMDEEILDSLAQYYSDVNGLVQKRKIINTLTMGCAIDL
jgi:hypothetical protein